MRSIWFLSEGSKSYVTESVLCATTFLLTLLEISYQHSPLWAIRWILRKSLHRGWYTTITYIVYIFSKNGICEITIWTQNDLSGPVLSRLFVATIWKKNSYHSHIRPFFEMEFLSRFKNEISLSTVSSQFQIIHHINLVFFKKMNFGREQEYVLRIRCILLYRMKVQHLFYT